VQEPEKLFTQEDVNRIVQERLKRERRKRADLHNYIAWLEEKVKEHKEAMSDE
jgi:bacterioferritin (cytochrome b1)